MGQDEWALRQMLFEEHRCPMKYGDDGERQCGACRIDFLRDSIEAIRKGLDDRNTRRLVEFSEAMDNLPDTTEPRSSCKLA